MQKLRYIWLCVLLILGCSFWPAHWPSSNVSYTQPNHLKIRFQECGCPCPDALIEKGTLRFNNRIHELYPSLSEKALEINLINCSILEGKNGRGGIDFDFISNNDFYVKGEVIGADTVACSPGGCELSPVFKVTDWEISSYYPLFWTFPVWLFLLLFIILLVGIPMLLMLTIMHKKHF